MQCDMLECKEEVFNSLSLGPGTYVSFCEKHYKQEKEYKDGTKDEGSITGMDEVGYYIWFFDWAYATIRRFICTN